jgi:hypothetical protein
LGRGIETYQSNLRENQERNEGQQKTINRQKETKSRQKAMIIGSLITAVTGWSCNYHFDNLLPLILQLTISVNGYQSTIDSGYLRYVSKN